MAEAGDLVVVTIKGMYPATQENYRQRESTEIDITPVDLGKAIPAPFRVQNSIGVWSEAELSAFKHKGFSQTNRLFLNNVEVDVQVKSPWKNGVYIDFEDGTYWMRRPDGWHYMHVAGDDMLRGIRTRPIQPQRLKEDKEHTFRG